MREGRIVKEGRERLGDRYVLFNIIVMPVLMVFVLGGLTLAASQSGGGEEGDEGEAALVILDPGDRYASILAQTLGWKVFSSIEEALESSDIVVVIPEGFGDALESGRPAAIMVYARIDEPSLAEAFKPGDAIGFVEDVVRLVLASERGLDPAVVLNPVVVDNVYLYDGRVLSLADLGYMIGLPLLAGFVAFILGSVVAQVGAISIALERESRMVETILSMPVTRLEIALAKLASVTLIGFIAVASFEAGFVAYMYMALETAPPEAGGEALLGQIASGIVDYMSSRPGALGFLALTSVLAAVNMAILGLVVGVLFAGDIRGATTSTGLIVIIAAAPVFFEMFIPGGSAPAWLNALFHASPIYYPFMMMKAYTAGDYGTTAIYIGVEIIYLALASAIASRLMGSEAMLYGARRAPGSIIKPVMLDVWKKRGR